MKSVTFIVKYTDSESVLFMNSNGPSDDPIFTWGRKEENIFIKKRSNAHNIFKYLMTSASCNDVGLSTFIQKLIHKNRTGKMRVIKK